MDGEKDIVFIGQYFHFKKRGFAGLRDDRRSARGRDNDILSLHILWDGKSTEPRIDGHMECQYNT